MRNKFLVSPISRWLVASSILVGMAQAGFAGTKYKVGDKVDVKHSDTYYKGVVKTASDQCIAVLYDDGTREDADKANLAAYGSQTDGTPKSSSLDIKAGEKADIKWTDGKWYKGKIESIRTCYKVEYIGWNGDSGLFNEDQLHPFGSKAKGDTSAAAAEARNKANGASAKPAKMSAEQKANCNAALKDRNKCMRYPYCEWRSNCAPKYE